MIMTAALLPILAVCAAFGALLALPGLWRGYTPLSEVALTACVLFGPTLGLALLADFGHWLGPLLGWQLTVY